MSEFEHCNEAKAQEYYDDNDSQLFYRHVFGSGTEIHIGMFSGLPNLEGEPAKVISAAQGLSKDNLVKHVRAKFGAGKKVRVCDLGCGYNSLLRHFAKCDILSSSIGLDISTEMIEKAQTFNQEYIAASAKKMPANYIESKIGSYLSTGLPEANVDCCVSQDAFLHVGPVLHNDVLKEAFRILKPGGYLIFSDILECDNVDVTAMQCIYQRIHLEKLGSVENYLKLAEEIGFVDGEFLDSSKDLSSHYSIVHKSLKHFIDQNKEAQMQFTPGFISKMEQGLLDWVRMAPDNIQWGVFCLRKPLICDQ